MSARNAPAPRVSVGRAVSETFSIYSQNFLTLIGGAIGVFVVFGIIAGILQTPERWFLSLIAAIVLLIGHALFIGFVVRLVQDTRDGRRDHSIGELFSSAAPAIGSLIVFGILFGIGVAIGLVLIIIPGLILLTFWSVGAAAIVVEGAGPIEAFGRSWRLVRGDAWSVFGALLVMLIIVIVIGFVLAAIATPIGDGAIVVANVIANVLTAPLFAVVVSVLFFDLGGGQGDAPAPGEATSAI